MIQLSAGNTGKVERVELKYSEPNRREKKETERGLCIGNDEGVIFMVIIDYGS